MLVSDYGILLYKTKFGDSGLILKMFTKGHGTMSFILQGLKGKNKSLVAIMNPLSEFEIVYQESKKSDLRRIKEVQIHTPFHNIRRDLNKGGLSFFLSEILLKCLREQEKQTSLYIYIKGSVELLDVSEKVGNFHLIFLLRLSKFLGFFPLGSFNGREFFDLQEGLFTHIRPNHLHYLEQMDSKIIYEILNKGYDFLDYTLSKSERENLLLSVLKYYRIHVEGFNELKSLSVLQELGS